MVMACGTPQPALSITRQLAETGDAPSGQIAFSSTREHGHLWWKTIDLEPEIYVMRADGSGLVNLTMNPAADWLPAWSPDGSKVSFVSDRAGNWEIYVMEADGSNQVNLTNHPAVDQDPDWSAASLTVEFGVAVNDKIVRLLGDEPGVDLERREWQVVEIPLKAFGPIHDLARCGIVARQDRVPILRQEQPIAVEKG